MQPVLSGNAVENSLEVRVIHSKDRSFHPKNERREALWHDEVTKEWMNSNHKSSTTIISSLPQAPPSKENNRMAHTTPSSEEISV